mmetsp:Transcript_110/g.162  ORF Transcript_110/g.162 Transcript_110/m.162 type:complete len:202 (+) Transcript_110:103-708(+)
MTKTIYTSAEFYTTQLSSPTYLRPATATKVRATSVTRLSSTTTTSKSSWTRMGARITTRNSKSTPSTLPGTCSSTSRTGMAAMRTRPECSDRKASMISDLGVALVVACVARMCTEVRLTTPKDQPSIGQWKLRCLSTNSPSTRPSTTDQDHKKANIGVLIFRECNGLYPFMVGSIGRSPVASRVRFQVLRMKTTGFGPALE